LSTARTVKNRYLEPAATPPNGQHVYFAINQTSGEITTTAVLDRESFGSKYLFFTVRAVDKLKILRA
jgi:hypothetical protein